MRDYQAAKLEHSHRSNLPSRSMILYIRSRAAVQCPGSSYSMNSIRREWLQIKSLTELFEVERLQEGNSLAGHLVKRRPTVM